MLDQGIGKRIKVARKLAGLTQEQLAQRNHYSVSTVRAVEQGREPTSMAFAAATASALGVPLEELTGQPYRNLLEEDGGLPGLAELRAIFAEGRYVVPIEPRPLTLLSDDVGQIRILRREDKARQALMRLPDVIRELHGAISIGDSTTAARAHGLLAHAYATATLTTYRFGYTSMAIHSVDRMEDHAARSDDSRLPIYSLIHRGHMLMASASYGLADDMVNRALVMLESEEVDEGTLSLRGAAHLRAAIVNARNWRPDTARDHIDSARVIGEQLGRTTYAYDTSMGPGNVMIHDIAVSLESGDPGRAARDGSKVVLPPDVQATRVGRHWMDIARAWSLEGKPDNALKALQNAKAVAPQQTKLHPNAQETLRAIAEAERRRSNSLANFATWMGMKI
ncbi:helix-turn-helix domain-containing protein [Actinokineospora bangkokensis]|uniref:HTH cro/C1-type domain-containing protein n=1 Tax=Actinokineospora bangkokensis TaxID=1193682 RepID=A0A1Q9LTS3_9PSEU|nr:helix-turn-helix domain-containing protein [Actinokineospora bangkokensis]OLR95447.1 hypothetical protein BJP25_06810 [Actinokineospora bangkokensis]